MGSAAEALQRCEELWMPWARAGHPPEVNSTAPTAPEAAFMMRRLASLAAPCPRGQRSSLVREPFVRGLLRHVVANAARVTSAEQRSQAVADTVWSLGVLAGPYLYAEEMAALVETPVNLERGLFQPPQVADLLWGLATCQHEPSRLGAFLEVVAATDSGLSEYSPRDITTVLWAVATLRPRQPVVAALLASSPRTWAGAGGWTPLELTTDQLSTAAWALAACGAAGAESPQLLRLWQEICERRDAFLGAAKTRFSLLRIHQVALTLDLESAYDPRELHPHGRNVMAAARRSWMRDSGDKRTKHVSHLQRELGAALASLGLSPLEESNVAGYSVDLTVPEHSLAIEADGPSHFSRTSGRLLGSAVLKRRHLRRSGWRVLSVPLATWEELIGPEERGRYLKAELQALRPGHLWPWS